MVQQNCQEETTNSENPLQGGNEPWGVKISVENFKAKPGQPQPTESKDDAEARADFWSIQGDFICRHHNELRVQLCAPKEETFPLPLKYVDVTRSTYWFGRHARKTCWWLLECRFEQKFVGFLEKWSGHHASIRYWWWECRFEQKFVGFLESIHKIHSVERETSQTEDMCGPGGEWQKCKRLRDQIMYGLKYGPKFGKPLRSEKNKNGKTSSPNLTMLDDWGESTSLIRDDQDHEETLQNSEKKIGKAYGRSHAVQKRDSD